MRSDPYRTVSRAQSTVLGTIMLVAVVVVAVTTFGTYSIASVTDEDDGPAVDVTGTLDRDGLTLVHAGGDGLATAALTIYASNSSTRETITFGDGTVTGDGDERFEPGERWTNDSSLPTGDRLTVWLVHDDSNAVLFEGRLREVTTVPPPPTPPGTPPETPPGTPTGTPTSTPTSTPTGTPTSTPTSTPTGTPTATPTPTPAPGSDTTPPTFVSLSASANGAGNSADSVTFTYNGTDDVAVDHYEFRVEKASNGQVLDSVTAGANTTTRVLSFAKQNMNKVDLRVVATVVDTSGNTERCEGTIGNNGQTISKSAMTCTTTP